MDDHRSTSVSDSESEKTSLFTPDIYNGYKLPLMQNKTYLGGFTRQSSQHTLSKGKCTSYSQEAMETTPSHSQGGSRPWTMETTPSLALWSDSH